MDAAKVVAILKRYNEDPMYSYVTAAFDLVAEGCTSLEASELLLGVDQPDAALQAIIDEEEFIRIRPENCICSDYSFETYDCTCQKRVQPG